MTEIRPNGFGRTMGICVKSIDKGGSTVDQRREKPVNPKQEIKYERSKLVPNMTRTSFINWNSTSRSKRSKDEDHLDTITTMENFRQEMQRRESQESQRYGSEKLIKSISKQKHQRSTSKNILLNFEEEREIKRLQEMHRKDVETSSNENHSNKSSRMN